MEISKFKELMMDTIRFYETGYEDEFWQLNLDEVYNYPFYFPNENANRLVCTSTKFSLS